MSVMQGNPADDADSSPRAPSTPRRTLGIMGDTSTNSAYATPAEVAERFSISRVTVYRMCDRGELAGAIRVGGQWRIPRETLDRIAAGE